MKKLFLSLAFLLAVTVAGAQPAFTFGPKAGLSLAGLSGFSDSRARFGFVGGGFASLRFNQTIGLQWEVLYSQQGERLKYTVAGQEVKRSLALDYLNVPVMAKIYFYKNLNIEAGVQAAFLINSEDKTDGATPLDLDNLNDYGIDGLIGLGYDFKRLTLSFRYNIGFIAIDPDLNQANSVLQLTAGFRF